MTPDPTRQLLTIGDFAHRTRLTPKVLRIYDEIGLLRPAGVDPSSGHREVTARPGSRLSCREVYVAEPEAIGDDEPVCDVAFPLG